MPNSRAKRNDAVTALQEVFPPKRIEEVFIPKANNRTRGYVKGVPFTKVRYEPFNPASRQQIADRLMEKHGWKPSEFTDTGQPKVDEDVARQPADSRMQASSWTTSNS